VGVCVHSGRVRGVGVTGGGGCRVRVTRGGGIRGRPRVVARRRCVGGVCRVLLGGGHVTGGVVLVRRLLLVIGRVLGVGRVVLITGLLLVVAGGGRRVCRRLDILIGGGRLVVGSRCTSALVRVSDRR